MNLLSKYSKTQKDNIFSFQSVINRTGSRGYPEQFGAKRWRMSAASVPQVSTAADLGQLFLQTLNPITQKNSKCFVQRRMNLTFCSLLHWACIF